MPAFIAKRSRGEQYAIFALLILVVVAVLYKLLTGGAETPITVPPSARPTPSASPTGSTLPQAPAVFEGKDPFQPLVSETTGTGGGGTPSPGPSGGPTSGGTNPSGRSHRVVLVDIFSQGGERVATVSVDGTEYTVHVGDTFATNYRLLSLTASCGTFVFGDERFTLCIGQEVRK